MYAVAIGIGIEIVRTELNEKVAAVDFTTATETKADGARRAEIKKAEGIKQAKILEAEGEAQAIQLVNEVADKSFVGNAQLLLIQLDDAEVGLTRFGGHPRSAKSA